MKHVQKAARGIAPSQNGRRANCQDQESQHPDHGSGKTLYDVMYLTLANAFIMGTGQA